MTEKEAYQKLIMKQIQIDGFNIKNLTRYDLIDSYDEFALAAIRENGLAIQYVDSSKVKDYYYICSEAVKKTGYAIKYIDLKKID